MIASFRARFISRPMHTCWAHTQWHGLLRTHISNNRRQLYATEKPSWCVRHQCLTLLLSRASRPSFRSAYQQSYHRGILRRACEALSQRHPSVTVEDPSVPPKSAAKFAIYSTPLAWHKDAGKEKKQAGIQAREQQLTIANASRRT